MKLTESDLDILDSLLEDWLQSWYKENYSYEEVSNIRNKLWISKWWIFYPNKDLI